MTSKGDCGNGRDEAEVVSKLLDTYFMFHAVDVRCAFLSVEELLTCIFLLVLVRIKGLVLSWVFETPWTRTNDPNGHFLQVWRQLRNCLETRVNRSAQTIQINLAVVVQCPSTNCLQLGPVENNCLQSSTGMAHDSESYHLDITPCNLLYVCCSMAGFWGISDPTQISHLHLHGATCSIWAGAKQVLEDRCWKILKSDEGFVVFLQPPLQMFSCALLLLFAVSVGSFNRDEVNL